MGRLLFPREPATDIGIQYLEKDPQIRAMMLEAEKRRRLRILQDCKNFPDYQRAMRERSRKDLRHFFDNFVWTFDPRDLQVYPMVLWPIQHEYLDFVERHILAQKDWLVEKSRDMGATYLNAGIAVHRWLFVPGFKTSFCANLVSLVDEQDNPDTIFEKIRMVIDMLPKWLRPASYTRQTCGLVNRIVNPDNGNVIIGEGGKNAGRGGRSTLYILDESAHIDNAQAVNASTSRNSRCRGWVSSANGMGNFFYERRYAMPANDVFTMHWRDHPLKDEAWAEEEKSRVGSETFAREDDIDYASSVSGLLVEKPWVDAAKELWKNCPHPEPAYRMAGLDIGAGKDFSVFQPRHGCLVPRAIKSRDPDTINTANWALELSRQYGTNALVYDSVGVGEGVKAALKRGWHILPDFRIIACAWGLPPTSNRRWQDGRTSKQRFRDIKADLWWTMREAFRCSFEHWRWMNGLEGGIEHDLDDCILLEASPELERELPTVTYRYTATGSKIEVEDKDSLRARGIKSPDFADALAYSYHRPPVVDFSEGVIIGGQRETYDPVDEE